MTLGLRPARALVVRHNALALRRLHTTRPLRAPVLNRSVTVLKYAGYFCLSSVVGVFALTTGLFVHDAFTYTDRHIERVPVNPLALHPEKGGPKNLPVVRAQVDDEEDEEQARLARKPRLVIVGGGWGAIATLQGLHPGDFHVTLVSSETFTTFTPLLPSAAQFRSLIEPVRKILARLRGHFVHGKAVDLVLSERLIEIETTSADGKTSNLYVPYDKLVIAVGSTSSTHGVPGLENCFQLKTIADAQKIRRRIMDNFEAASLPTTSPEERRRLLSFVVCGGGPTGVETAAEIYDFCQEDIMNYYPKICREEVTIHVIQSREHILNTYSEAISNYAESKFERDGVDLVTSAKVGAITPDHVIYTTKDADGNTEQRSIPTNFVLWSTGIAMNPFAERVTDLLPNQVHKKAIEVDAHLRVKGTAPGSVYAVGDCSTIETSIVSHLLDLVKEADRNEDGVIDYDEWEIMVARIKQKIPMAADHLSEVKQLFELYDKDADNSLTLNELTQLLSELGNKITALPATAQVASQQGKYVGKKLHKIARQLETSEPIDDESVSRPFRYRHLGSLAYIGNAAVFDMGSHSFMGGLVAMYAWRSVYWSESVSLRTRALLMIDWVIRGPIFASEIDQAFDMPSIVFYDVALKEVGACRSPNTLKSRYALNFKGLEYTTKWLEYPEIEDACKAIGGKPTRNKPDGTPLYTLPMIHDLNTGAVITDSFEIAVYLDKTYPAPEYPPLMPPNSGGFGLIAAFDAAMGPLLAEVFPFAFPGTHALFNPPSADYFRREREPKLGMTLEEYLPPPGSEYEKTQWAKVKASFGTIDGWIAAGGPENAFFGGHGPNYADFYVAAVLVWLSVVVSQDKWADMKTWHGGRWAKLLDSLKEYERA
ncbi:hypothetical protein HMN09_00026700 [Mycena chlorophos]|uniref:NADH:ubiquinone reductase (non-electrogenic) n=1 Tax=Mycena chlorophos TaxID=658473 RepID=A0A8H6TP12_MYCCL|nr:hypothetical protein HMN09_00026700 [Mycena chlorophos]